MLADRAMAPMVLTPHGSWWLGDLPLIPVRYEHSSDSGFWPAISLAHLGLLCRNLSMYVSPSSGVIVTSFRKNLPLSAARGARGASPFRWPQ